MKRRIVRKMFVRPPSKPCWVIRRTVPEGCQYLHLLTEPNGVTSVYWFAHKYDWVSEERATSILDLLVCLPVDYQGQPWMVVYE